MVWVDAWSGFQRIPASSTQGFVSWTDLPRSICDFAGHQLASYVRGTITLVLSGCTTRNTACEWHLLCRSKLRAPDIWALVRNFICTIIGSGSS